MWSKNALYNIVLLTIYRFIFSFLFFLFLWQAKYLQKKGNRLKKITSTFDLFKLEVKLKAWFWYNWYNFCSVCSIEILKTVEVCRQFPCDCKWLFKTDILLPLILSLDQGKLTMWHKGYHVFIPTFSRRAWSVSQKGLIQWD